ncbi:MAG: hypothetical protein LUE27_03195 [Clostridia bacterium]|nr:hypothetical protein [Clostridia bacterium]
MSKKFYVCVYPAGKQFGKTVQSGELYGQNNYLNTSMITDNIYLATENANENSAQNHDERRSEIWEFELNDDNKERLIEAAREYGIRRPEKFIDKLLNEKFTICGDKNLCNDRKAVKNMEKLKDAFYHALRPSKIYTNRANWSNGCATYENPDGTVLDPCYEMYLAITITVMPNGMKEWENIYYNSDNHTEEVETKLVDYIKINDPTNYNEYQEKLAQLKEEFKKLPEVSLEGRKARFDAGVIPVLNPYGVEITNAMVLNNYKHNGYSLLESDGKTFCREDLGYSYQGAEFFGSRACGPSKSFEARMAELNIKEAKGIKETVTSRDRIKAKIFDNLNKSPSGYVDVFNITRLGWNNFDLTHMKQQRDFELHSLDYIPPCEQWTFDSGCEFGKTH